MRYATNELLRGAWPSRPRASSARFAERVFHGIGMMGDDRKKNARWTVRLGSALLPVSYCCRGESEARGEPGLAEAELLANCQNVDRSRAIHLDVGDADAWNVLASGVGEGLVEAGYKAATGGRGPRRALLSFGFGLRRHSGYYLLSCSALIAAIALRAAFFSAADRFAFWFLA